MDDETFVKKGKGILQIGWVLLLLYMLGVYTYIYFDSRTNTEYYALLEQKPNYNEKDLILAGDQYIAPDGTKIPAWHLRASTVEECKPLKRISDLWNDHGLRMLYIAIILTAIKIVLDNMAFFKRIMPKDDEENKEEEKPPI